MFNGVNGAYMFDINGLLAVINGEYAFIGSLRGF